MNFHAERLEDRLLLATFSVTNTLDSGSGSLRQAILDANANAGSDTIEFSIGGPGPYSIQPLSGLPAITDPVVIDGATQPGYAGKPIIELDGSLAGSAQGLNLVSGSTTVRGLVINRFGGNGIFIPSGSGNVIEGNFIGTDISGTVAMGNQATAGIFIFGSDSNRIGTDGDGVNDDIEGNLISGNRSSGVQMAFGLGNNVVAGNYIGTDVTGTLPLPNEYGVWVQSAANRVGTNGDGLADDTERNVISGNLVSGVLILSPETKDNHIAGNYVGLDATGTAGVGNGSGIDIFDAASSNLIGTDSDGLFDEAERNVISGNVLRGITIGQSGSNNVVAGNYIGTDLTGTKAVSNGQAGVLMDSGANLNLIGTNSDGLRDAVERNVISGNGRAGIQIRSANTDFNVVAGNFIGTDVTGSFALGNGVLRNRDGVAIRAGAKFNRVGTNGDGVADHSERNIISGNSRNGVLIADAGSEQNVVAGNYIGTDETGTAPLGNALTGVVLVGGAANNRIGTNGNGIADSVERNVISANGFEGVIIRNSNNNTIAGNLIGADATATSALGNIANGVHIVEGASSNRIGTNSDGVSDTEEGNLIAFNTEDGIVVSDTGTQGNVIRGNSIHSNDGLGIDLGGDIASGRDGVTLNDPGDGDTGSNGLQNFPLLTNVLADASSTQVIGTLDSLPNTMYTLEFFGNSILDPSGFGEGERLLGSTTVVTDSSGIANFDIVLNVGTAAGEFITATATEELTGNTSEFSSTFVAIGLAQIDVKPGSDPNSINLGNNGVIPIAILTTDGFDAAQVDASTVEFAGASPVHNALEDVDEDGDLDMVLHFRTQDTNLLSVYSNLLGDADTVDDGILDAGVSNRQTVTVSLTGRLLTGEEFVGFAEIEIFLSGKRLKDLLTDLAIVGMI